MASMLVCGVIHVVLPKRRWNVFDRQQREQYATVQEKIKERRKKSELIETNLSEFF
jgi:hypothetical protein